MSFLDRLREVEYRSKIDDLGLSTVILVVLFAIEFRRLVLLDVAEAPVLPELSDGVRDQVDRWALILSSLARALPMSDAFDLNTAWISVLEKSGYSCCSSASCSATLLVLAAVAPAPILGL